MIAEAAMRPGVNMSVGKEGLSEHLMETSLARVEAPSSVNVNFRFVASRPLMTPYGETMPMQNQMMQSA